MTTDHEGSLLVAFILALQSVIYTYDGWSAVIYFSEEVKDYGTEHPAGDARRRGDDRARSTSSSTSRSCAVVSLPTIAGNNFAAGVVVERLFGAQRHERAARRW